ncbi:hypothetical protein BRADI_3g03299v3, partial [Brachypodium distachyon]
VRPTAPVSSALHRINPARLFHPENHSPDQKKKASPAPAVENCRLPRPAMTFRSHHGDNNGIQHLMLLGRGKDKILVLGDEDGQAAIYDDGGGAGAGSFHALPRAPTAARRSTEPLSVALGDGLCVLKECPGEGDKERSVEALVWGQDPRERGWRYSRRALPPPPPHARKKEDPFGVHGLRYEKAGESGLWVSAAEGGTYALDTAAGERSKVGDWALPFTWRAEYAPEHGLWFGFSSSPSYGEPSQLCAEWVTHLGCGRFCLARLVKEKKRPPRGFCSWCCVVDARDFAVLTGVEVRRDEDGGGLRLVEHKTCRYSLGHELSQITTFLC